MSKPQIRQPQYRKSHGFTLIELMTTVVVLAILTAVAAPYFRSFVIGQRLKTTSFDIISMLTITRSEAIKRNAQVTAMPINNDWAQGWTVTAPTNIVISRQNAVPPGSLTISCKQGGLSQPCGPISYNANGRSNNSYAIQISSSLPTVNNKRCISIDLSGRPSRKQGDC